MSKIKTLLKVYKDKPAVMPAARPITEQKTQDSNLVLNPTIKDKNFFEDETVVDFLLDKTKNK